MAGVNAAVPLNETERLEALYRCGVLDTEPEPTFDEIAALASQLCATPIALVSLVDGDRQWFKARVGLLAAETPRDVSFCAHAVVSREPLVVPDTHEDARFVGNPLVTGDPHIRFYAGVPLILDDGLAVGTLCVIDRVPRRLTDAQLAALAMLGRQVTTELRLRRALISAQSERVSPPRSVRDSDSELAQGTSVRVRPGPVLDVETLGSMARKLRRESVIARRYRIERMLGAGGMGVVAAATDVETGEPVAIKFLIHHHTGDRAGLLERFVREAQALLRVQSEHVVRVVDVGNLANGAPYIVMERLDGEDLGARLALRGPGSPAEVVHAVSQACIAVASAHACGIIHRDLKPANLFAARRPDGGTVIKVLDFGISKLAQEGAAALTQISTMVGSVYYMSPEQMNNDRDIDGRSDLWSLGVTLYELLTGTLPFEGESISEVCSRVLMSAPIPPQKLRPELPAALCKVVMRCLAPNREDRPATAEELAVALVGSLPGRVVTSSYAVGQSL